MLGGLRCGRPADNVLGDSAKNVRARSIALHHNGTYRPDPADLGKLLTKLLSWLKLERARPATLAKNARALSSRLRLLKRLIEIVNFD